MSTTPNTNANSAATLAARSRAMQAPEGQGIHLSELAAKHVRDYISKTESPETTYLFFGVKGGGCSGLSYVLDLRDEQVAPIADTDEVFESHGIVIACDFKSYEVGNLSGTTIDFEDGMMGKGFTFKNPNAKHRCGCGSSYSA